MKKKKYIPYSEKADLWIKENNDKIVKKSFRTCYNAETIMMSSHGGFLIRQHIFELFIEEDTEHYSGLRLLFKAMSENRIFSRNRVTTLSEGCYGAPEYKISEFQGEFLVEYKVPALLNIDVLIDRYLSGGIRVNVDFDELEMWLLSDPDEEHRTPINNHL